MRPWPAAVLGETAQGHVHTVLIVVVHPALFHRADIRSCQTRLSPLERVHDLVVGALRSPPFGVRGLPLANQLLAALNQRSTWVSENGIMLISGTKKNQGKFKMPEQ